MLSEVGLARPLLAEVIKDMPPRLGSQPHIGRSACRNPNQPAMTPLFKKLNLGPAQVVHVLDAPTSFERELAGLQGVEVQRAVTGEVAFGMAFVKTLAEVEEATSQLTRTAQADAVLWMVYPKGSSKVYRCEFNRDTGWASLGEAGYEPVRQVAVDEDWSALRFRKVEHIKTMKRNPEGAISSAGRRKAREQRA